MHHKLPDEILEHILCLHILDFQDIINVSKTCSKYHSICQSNKIWMMQLLKQWEPKFQCAYQKEHDLKTKFMDLYAIETNMIKIICHLSTVKRHFRLVMIDSVKDLTEDPDRLLAVLDITHKLKHHLCNEQLDCVKKVFEYLYYYYLKRQWIELLSTPEDDPSHIEKGLILISQWSYPESEIYFNEIDKKIDVIADAVKSILPHDLSPEYLSSYENCLLILNMINKVLYENLGFKGKKKTTEANSHLHRVLEQKEGNPLSLGVLYISVARRLGLKLQGVNFPGHFLIRLMFDENVVSKIYLDASNCGKLFDKKQCLELLPERYSKWREESLLLFLDIDNKRIYLRVLTDILYALRDNDNNDDQSIPKLDVIETLMHIMVEH